MYFQRSTKSKVLQDRLKTAIAECSEVHLRNKNGKANFLGGDEEGRSLQVNVKMFALFKRIFMSLSMIK